MSEAQGPRADQLDEQKIARLISLGLPAVTVAGALGAGVVLGPATGVLILAGGLLLGVIAILWGSLRILSGDAILPPELDELDMRSQGYDALASRKKMLLRALKDLENERAIGKIEQDDYEPIAAQYRADLKGVLTKIDESLAPNRALAEEAVAAYLKKPAPAKAEEKPADTRVECPKCKAKNEPDAKFCKECATKLHQEAEVTDA
jgi:hypothetical protein